MKKFIKIGLLVLPFISYAQTDSLKQSPLEFTAGIQTIGLSEMIKPLQR